MSQRYVNIEDETFPSFLAESMSSNLSEALDNCTLASNLGLPVAASTVAKARTAFERLSDVQASYLENEKLSATTDLFTLSHSGGDRNGKFVLSFKDDMECLDAFIEAKNQAHNADVMDKSSKESSHLVLDFLPTERNDGFSSGLGLVSDAKLDKNNPVRFPVAEALCRRGPTTAVKLLGSDVTHTLTMGLSLFAVSPASASTLKPLLMLGPDRIGCKIVKYSEICFTGSD